MKMTTGISVPKSVLDLIYAAAGFKYRVPEDADVEDVLSGYSADSIYNAGENDGIIYFCRKLQSMINEENKHADLAR